MAFLAILATPNCGESCLHAATKTSKRYPKYIKVGALRHCVRPSTLEQKIFKDCIAWPALVNKLNNAFFEAL